MAAPVRTCQKYLIQFAHEHLDFRIPEVLSLAKIFDIPLEIPASYNPTSPYLLVDLPSQESVKLLASRAILIKSIYELWGQGNNYNGLFTSLKALPNSHTSPHLSSSTSFKIKHDSFNKQLTQKEKVKLIERVIDNSGLSFLGPINLNKPDQSFHILEDYGRQDVTSAPNDPQQIYFARWITDGHRDSIKKYDLKKRKFIGNTSMDPALALIMANMGKVSDSKLVYDPFVGTGSLLVASAHFGGHVTGTEIDWRILHGRGRSSRANQKWRNRDDNIENSLRQYGLAGRYVDVMVADAARKGMWREGGVFDAIITDPPYGIREKTEKIGTKKEETVVPEEMKEGHIPSKVTYDLAQILLDLLNFAARYLTLGGCLVYWLPVDRENYVVDHVPKHPCLQLVANSEQVLNARVARRLITMEKVHEYQEDLQLSELAENHYRDASFRDRYFRPSEKGPCDRKYKKHCKDDTGSYSPDGGKEEKSCDQQSGSCDQSADVAETRTDDARQETERPPNT